MKTDERRLLRLVADGVKPRDAGEALGIPWKRVAYICEKWSRKGWYDYGVTVDLGWLEQPGREAAARLT